MKFKKHQNNNTHLKRNLTKTINLNSWPVADCELWAHGAPAPAPNPNMEQQQQQQQNVGAVHAEAAAMFGTQASFHNSNAAFQAVQPPTTTHYQPQVHAPGLPAWQTQQYPRSNKSRSSSFAEASPNTVKTWF